MHITFLNPQGNFDPLDTHSTAHPDFGGQLVYVKQLALALGRHGHRADILTRQIMDPEWPEFANAGDSYPGNPNVRIIRLPCGPTRFLPKEELWPHLHEWIDRVERWYAKQRVLPDLWSGHYADGGLSAAALQERTGVPSCFTAHSLGAWKLDFLLGLQNAYAADNPVARGETLARLDATYRFGARIPSECAAIARAGAIITSTVGERYEQYQHPAYRDVVSVANDRRFAIIPPGVNEEIFHPDARSPREDVIREAIAAALERDIGPGRRHLPAVIAWSRLDPKKNYAGLLRAFADSAELRERANLLMITRGLDDPLHKPQMASPIDQEVVQELASEAEHSHLWGQVSAFNLGGQDAVAALYRWGVEIGAVFCLPAEYEPFGFSVIEAMAVGMPVVATSHGGPRETTDGGRAGLLADPRDPHDLATQLLRVVADSTLWQRLAARGRERVAQVYSWERAADRYVAVANEIIRGERWGNAAYPLPSFVADGWTGELPHLKNWEAAARVI